MPLIQCTTKYCIKDSIRIKNLLTNRVSYFLSESKKKSDCVNCCEKIYQEYYRTTNNHLFSFQRKPIAASGK